MTLTNGGKRKAPGFKPPRKAKRTIHSDDEDDGGVVVDEDVVVDDDRAADPTYQDTGETEVDEPEGPDPEDTEDHEMGYTSLKAMADADHDVSYLFMRLYSSKPNFTKAIHAKSKDDATADIRTIFRRDKENKNPDTNKTEAGYWCKLCL
jgi:hypothetical protein